MRAVSSPELLVRRVAPWYSIASDWRITGPDETGMDDMADRGE